MSSSSVPATSAQATSSAPSTTSSEQPTVTSGTTTTSSPTQPTSPTSTANTSTSTSSSFSSPSSSLSVPSTTSTNNSTGSTTTPSTTTTPSATSSTNPSSPTNVNSSATSQGTTTTSTPASTTPTTTSMSTVLTQVPTTITSTNAVGSTVTLTSEVSTYTTVPAPVNASTTSSNTGPIVGGIVGAIAVIGLLGLLVFCIRRRRRKSEFDGNFDPDRVVSQPSGGGTFPQIDLGDDHEITPFDQGMRQYGDSPYLAAGAAGVGRATSAGGGRPTSPLSSPSQYSDAGTSYHPASVSSPSAEGYPSQAFMRPGPQGQGPGAPNMYAMQQQDWHNPRPMTSPPPSVSNTSSSGRAMKEMEAQSGRQGLGLATQHELDGEGQGSGVVQHQDAGRAPGSEEGETPRDIPPAYDSIRQ